MNVQLHNSKTEAKRALFYIQTTHSSICKKFSIKQEMSRVPFTGQETKMWHILSKNTEKQHFLIMNV